MKKRKIYGQTWEYIRAGQWRSACGWYSAHRTRAGFWEGNDLSGDIRPWLSSTLAGVVWLVAQEEWLKKHS